MNKMKQKIILTSAIILLSREAFSVEVNTTQPITSGASSMTLPQTQAVKETDRQTKLSVNAALVGVSSEDKVMNSKQGGPRFDLAGSHKFTSYLKADIDVSLFVMTGALTNRYTNEGSAPNGFLLGRAVLEVAPVSWAYLQVGVLDVSFSSIISTWDNQGFPGLQEGLVAKTDSFEATVWASQTIPTSSTKEVRSSENGINTQLNLVGLTLSNDPNEKRDFKLQANATHFQFKNITTSAATDSIYLGNTVTPVGSQARFTYEFEGNEFAGLMGYKFTERWKMEVSGSELRNNAAPEQLNKAQYVQGKIFYKTNGPELGLTMGSFANESDSLPAVFTSSRSANNNRFGYTVKIDSNWEKEKFTTYMRYTQANEIVDRPFSADRTTISIGLEAAYEIL